jgi:hypothetical protein
MRGLNGMTLRYGMTLRIVAALTLASRGWSRAFSV